MLENKRKEIANQVGNLLENTPKPLTMEDLFLNTIMSAERAITELEDFKESIKTVKGKTSVHDMLLLSSEFKMMYNDIVSIRREYHL